VRCLIQSINQPIDQSLNSFISGNKAYKHTDTQTDRETDTQAHLPTTSYNRQEQGLICHKLIRTKQQKDKRADRQKNRDRA